MIRVIHRDRLYVPTAAVDSARLKDLLEVPYQTKAHCHTGCPLASKQRRYCSTCPGRDARIKMWERIRTSGGLDLIAMSGGNTRVLDHVIRKGIAYEIVDKRADVPFRHPLTWRGKLRRGETVDGRRTADQAGMLRSWRRRTNSGESGGIVISPPRSGKCVLPDTLIRTNRGYHHISQLFTDVERYASIEQIGRYGQVSAPGGVRDIRGRYQQVVDVHVVVDLVGGASIGGSLVHPIKVLVDDDDHLEPEWRRLCDLTGTERVQIARETADPVPRDQGLTLDQAGFIGSCLRLADYAKLRTGVLHFDAETLDDHPSLLLLLHSVCDAVPGGRDFMCDVREVPVLRDWVRLLMESTHDAWRAFVLSTMTETPDDCTARLTDGYAARAYQQYLLGQGVLVERSEPSVGVHLISVMDTEAWDSYVEGETLDPDDEQFLEIVQIRRILKRQVVQDLRVPDGASFNSNGVISHNTVIGVGASMSTRQRTFITASKIDFLRQFGMRYGELTNLRELYARGRRPVVLIDPKGWVDGPHYGVHVLKKWGPDAMRADVVMSCFQQFLDTTHGKKRMAQYLIGRFGLFIGDEIHQAAAVMFSRLANRIDARRMLGLTATIHRKDCVHPDSVIDTPLGPCRAGDVEVGDWVYCYNLNTREREAEPVSAVHRRPAQRMVRVRFGDDSLVVTPDHEFWSVTRGDYIMARDLKPGEELLPSRPVLEVSPR